MDGKELVDQNNSRGFNELRGYFFRDSMYASSMQNPATVNILENGPLCSKLEINGTINKHPFTQTLTLMNNDPLIDLNERINWNGNPGIGNDFKQKGGYGSVDSKKAFYNDSDKLLTYFPISISSQRVYKNAPFDVTESKLENTFFKSWDSIKNNIILNWVDIASNDDKLGVALFSNHTTSYSHGENFPLALTTQYSGVGLWGGNYSITGPTEIHYAILPHANKWDKAGIWTANTDWNNPMSAVAFQAQANPAEYKRSLLNLSDKGIEVTAITMKGNDLLVRLFNAEAEGGKHQLSIDGTADAIDVVELNGDKKQQLQSAKTKQKKSTVTIDLPRFAIRTIVFRNFQANQTAQVLSSR